MSDNEHEQMIRKLFAAYLDRDVRIQAYYLNLIAGSYMSDEEALEELNRTYCGEPTLTPSGPRLPQRVHKFTDATIRQWAADSPLFGEALKVARQMRQEAVDRQLWLEANPPPPPEEWPAMGRLDQRPDPFRIEREQPAHSDAPIKALDGSLLKPDTMEPLSAEQAAAWEATR